MNRDEREPREGDRNGGESAPERARAAQADKSRALQDLPEDERRAADPDDLPDVGGEHDPSPTDPPNAPDGARESEHPKS